MAGSGASSVGAGKNKGAKFDQIKRSFARQASISLSDVVMKFFNDKQKIERSEANSLVREFNNWRKKNPMKSSAGGAKSGVVREEPKKEESRPAPMLKSRSSYGICK